jgi:hypothetical protein
MEIKSQLANEIQIIALVADNEPLNRAAYNLLKEDYPFLIYVPCAAHTVQLCVKTILNLDVISVIMDEFTNLLTQYKSKDLRVTLYNVHSATLNGKTPLKLLDYCPTRWSSQLISINRMIELQPYINILTKKSPSFWNNLRILADFLTPFAQATDIIQADSSTLADIYNQFRILLHNIDSLPQGHILFGHQDAVKSIIINKWKTYINTSAVIMSALISFNESICHQFPTNEIESAQNWFIEFGVEYLSFYQFTLIESKEDLEDVLRAQLSSFNQRMNQFQGMNGYIARQKQLQAKQNILGSITPFNPKVIWGFYLNTAPELSKISIALLSVCASEASVERSFSLQSIVHSKRRNRLGDKSIEKEMFIKFNTQALTCSAINSKSDPMNFEMDDDYIYPPQLFTIENETESESDGDKKEDAIVIDGNLAGKPSDREENPIVVDRESSQFNPESQVPNSSESFPITKPKERKPEIVEFVDYEKVDQFLLNYIEQHSLSAAYRWSDDRRNALEQAAINQTIKFSTFTLQKRIKYLLEKKLLATTALESQETSIN